MRALSFAAAVVAGCGVPSPRQQVFPTLETGSSVRVRYPSMPIDGFIIDNVAQGRFFPAPAAYNSRIVALRTSLGRAAIALQLAGRTTTIRTDACADADSSAGKGCIRCELAGEADALDGAVLDTVTAAFDLYPAAALEATHIETVALCSRLVSDDEEPAGIAQVQARRLFVSVAPFIGRRYRTTGPFTTDDIVHHELFHVLDFQRMGATYRNDAEWRLLNAPGVAYAEGAEFRPRKPGFVNAYAATSEVEDRASVFQYIMARPDELCALGADDPVIRAKTRLVWERVAPLLGDSLLRSRAGCAAAWIETLEQRSATGR